MQITQNFLTLHRLTKPAGIKQTQNAIILSENNVLGENVRVEQKNSTHLVTVCLCHF